MSSSRYTSTARLLLLAAALVTLLSGYRVAEAGRRIGIVQFVNYSEANEAADTLMPMITRQLEARGFEIAPHDTLRNLMRHQRIRMIGMLTTADAVYLSNALGLDYLITGSIDFYQSQANPEVGLSVRIFDCRQGQVIWAASLAATGQDFAGLFGIGRITMVSPLATKVVDRLFDDCPFKEAKVSGESLALATVTTNKDGLDGRVAIISLDNRSSYLHAGDIVANILLSQLRQNGYQVAEPGDVSAALAELRSIPRGELSLQDVMQLRDKLKVALIVTGTVYQFQSGAGGSESVPQIEIGMRLIEAADGKVVSSTSSSRKGDDSELLFGTGIHYSLGKLAADGLRSGWQKLLKERAKRLTIANQTRGK
jgi:TolB-like protein